ncbi:metal ABC transporter ATP-binding protein [Clostridium amazonitimonense]|uniref:metal ABC transporter ATP-binding protein n=1 Tax=Clostridium amazonitimonense TaxID=1499689 RepID=UPI0005098297|nr:metal ABC transporter ATP-binding protein [Clostridium amazonitimonense]
MIQIKNLCFSYEGSEPYILDNVNLHIPEGSYFSIVGENGSAKSTLIKLILKLLKPVKGSIELGTSNIGYVPQKLDSFNSQFPITVKELLTNHKKVSKIDDANSIEKSLDIVSMGAYKNKLIGSLSGGQQQKIFIGRALMGSPKLLILDEPSTGIDLQSQKEIYSIIKKLNAEKNITVISVEHNLDAVLENSTNVYELSSGNGILYTCKEYKNKILNVYKER